MQAEAPSYAPAPRLPLWRQFRVVFQIQFSDYRDTAVILVMFSLIVPLCMLWLLGDTLAGKGVGAAWMQAGNGEFGPRFWLMIALLAAWLCAALLYTTRKLDWRSE